MDVNEVLTIFENKQTIREHSQIRFGHFGDTGSLQIAEKRSVCGRSHTFKCKNVRQKVNQKESVR